MAPFTACCLAATERSASPCDAPGATPDFADTLLPAPTAPSLTTALGMAPALMRRPVPPPLLLMLLLSRGCWTKAGLETGAVAETAPAAVFVLFSTCDWNCRRMSEASSGLKKSGLWTVLGHITHTQYV